MNNFIETTEVFVKNINQSLMEREQWIDSFEILLDKMVDYQSKHEDADGDFGRLLSLLEVLMCSMKFRQDADEDTAQVYEIRKLKEFKQRFSTLEFEAKC